MFSDLNRHAVRPTKSLDILYDNRDTFSLLIKDCIREIPIFNGSVECEKSAISNRSAALFTLSGIYHATKILFSGHPEMTPEDMRRTVIDFWSAVCDNMIIWNDAKTRSISPETFRKEYVCAHAITLKAIGTVGKLLLSLVPDHTQWSEHLAFLQEINWSNLEMSWLTFAGENHEIYEALVRAWCIQNDLSTDDETLAKIGLTGISWMHMRIRRA